METNTQVLLIASYDKGQYKKLLETAKDSHALDATWEDWKKNKETLVNNMQRFGVVCKEVSLDVVKFNEYCRQNNLSNTGETRSQYALHIANNEH